jgi:hypothetical protein
MVLKILAMGLITGPKAYLKAMFNVMDFVIVMAELIKYPLVATGLQ